MQRKEAPPQRNSGEVIRHTKPIYLVSSSMPGSGSTTVAEILAEQLAGGDPNADIYQRFIGREVRKLKGAESEQKLQDYEQSGRAPRDPYIFDAEFYREALLHDIAVIEGKKATKVGVDFIRGQRPTVSIELYSSPLTSAVRIMRREGYDIDSIIQKPASIFWYLREVSRRTGYLRKMDVNLRNSKQTKSNKKFPPFDATRLRAEEIVGEVMGNCPWEDHVPDWEYEALQKMQARLYKIHLAANINPLDDAQFRHNFERLDYQIKALMHNANRYALPTQRENIRVALTHSVFALLIKALPRFFKAQNGRLDVDTISQKWTPEYYKIANLWPTIEALLKGKTVLDPFAGAGTFMTVLAARGVPKSVVYGDWSYPGGKSVNHTEYVYNPKLNVAMLAAVFDELPSWYKPLCDQVVLGHITADASRLPFAPGSFDFIAADPPYGKNLAEGDYSMFARMLPELNAVAREGGIYLIPKAWIDSLSKSGNKVELLTADLSRGASNFPIAAVFIPKQDIGEAH